MTSLEQLLGKKTSEDTSSVLGVHHIELWVGNALQAAHYFRNALGFTIMGFAGPSTKCMDRVSYLMAQGTCHLVLTSGLDQTSPITKWVHTHGDGVRDVALSVRSVEDAWQDAIRWGAKSIEEPHVEWSQGSEHRKCVITAFGDTVHTLISGKNESNGWSGSFRPIDSPLKAAPIVSDLDHIAVAVGYGCMENLADFYASVFGMAVTHREDIQTTHSGMRSQVLENDAGSVRFTIVEPVEGSRTSQVQEFVRSHADAGVQHIALLTPDIFSTAAAMKAAGVEFLSPPELYYSRVAERLSESPFDTQALRQLGILLDRDEWGYLLQIFSKPVHSRPTLFVELIQRNGARGFGRGNIRALFEAIELEQAMRENS